MILIIINVFITSKIDDVFEKENMKDKLKSI